MLVCTCESVSHSCVSNQGMLPSMQAQFSSNDLVLLEVRAVGHGLRCFPHPVAVLRAAATELQLGADVPEGLGVSTMGEGIRARTRKGKLTIEWIHRRVKRKRRKEKLSQLTHQPHWCILTSRLDSRFNGHHKEVRLTGIQSPAGMHCQCLVHPQLARVLS